MNKLIRSYVVKVFWHGKDERRFLVHEREFEDEPEKREILELLKEYHGNTAEVTQIYRIA